MDPDLSRIVRHDLRLASLSICVCVCVCVSLKLYPSTMTSTPEALLLKLNSNSCIPGPNSEVPIGAKQPMLQFKPLTEEI